MVIVHPQNNSFSTFWVGTKAYALGESPAWCSETGVLSWVDIEGKTLVLARRTSHEQIEILEERLFPDRVGFAIPLGRGRYLVAQGSRLAISGTEGIEELSGSLLPAGHRFNDAAIDPSGQLLVGSLSLGKTSSKNYLIRVHTDGQLQVLADDVVLANGICSSPQDDFIFFVDSGKRWVERWSFNTSTGEIGDRSVFSEVLENEAVPDGLACDEHGNLWVALWGAGKLIQIRSDGELASTVSLGDSRYVTSLTFWGSELNDVCVTTALTPFLEDSTQPDHFAGRTFCGSLGTRGVALHPWVPVELAQIKPIRRTVP